MRSVYVEICHDVVMSHRMSVSPYTERGYDQLRDQYERVWIFDEICLHLQQAIRMSGR